MSSTIKARPRSFSRISGLGIFRPERVVTNDEICQKIESSDEWIRERSGIIERRFADADTTIIDMSVAAAERAATAVRNFAERVVESAIASRECN